MVEVIHLSVPVALDALFFALVAAFEHGSVLLEVFRVLLSPLHELLGLALEELLVELIGFVVTPGADHVAFLFSEIEKVCAEASEFWRKFLWNGAVVCGNACFCHFLDAFDFAVALLHEDVALGAPLVFEILEACALTACLALEDGNFLGLGDVHLVFEEEVGKLAGECVEFSAGGDVALGSEDTALFTEDDHKLEVCAVGWAGNLASAAELFDHALAFVLVSL